MNLKKTEQSGNFEMDSLAAFEKLLQGYKRANQSSVWESEIDVLIDKITHLPTDPFAVRLMKLFDYNYLVLSESIDTIIEKSFMIREQMKHTQRAVYVDERYYSIPFLRRRSYLKKLAVYNNERELCYLTKGKIHINYTNLFKRLIYFGKRPTGSILSATQETTTLKELEIYYYSPFINLSSTNRDDYYRFFCDYYSKIQFANYFVKKDTAKTTLPEVDTGQRRHHIEEALRLSSSQQVLWAYFLFRIIGLKLRVNLEPSILTRFLLVVNENSNISKYKNTYFYKLVSKAPYFENDKKLLADLEVVKLYFQKSKLPTGDIEKEILNLITR